jgi:hypothetical protein
MIGVRYDGGDGCTLLGISVFGLGCAVLVASAFGIASVFRLLLAV